ncbi:MAG: ABC transporter permease [Planctomycetota bacterium]|jgi:lipopolysaccharide transport system permease protein
MSGALPVRRIGPGTDRALDSLRDLWASRDLLWAVAWREFRVRYKQSLLGVAWAVVHPLALMLVFTAVFSELVGIKSEGVPYPLFSYAALLPWTFFATSITLATHSMVKQVELVTKVWFPREVLPLGSVLASLCDFVIALALFGGLLAWYGAIPGATALFLVALIPIQFALTAGMALFLSALNVRYRDVKFLVPLALQLWLYASPVIYSLDAVPAHVRPWYALNPMVGLVDGYRAALLHQAAPDPLLLGLSAAGSLLILVLGWAYFHRVEAYFADVI